VVGNPSSPDYVTWSEDFTATTDSADTSLGSADLPTLRSFDEIDNWISTKPVINLNIHVCMNAQTNNIVGLTKLGPTNVWAYFSNIVENQANEYLMRDLRINLTLHSVKFYTNETDHPWSSEDTETSNRFRRHIIDHCGYKLLNNEPLLSNATDGDYTGSYSTVVTSWSSSSPVNEDTKLHSYFMEDYIDRSASTTLEERVESYLSEVSRVWVLHYTNAGSESPLHVKGPATAWDGLYEGPPTFGASADVDVFVHEFGHTLGAKHPQDIDTGDGQVEKGSYEKARGINYNFKMCSFHQPQGGVWGLSQGVETKPGVSDDMLKSSIKHCDASDPNAQVAFLRYDGTNWAEDTGMQCDHLHPWQWKNKYITSMEQINEMNQHIDTLDIIDNLPCNKRDHGMDSEYGSKRLLYGELYPVISHNQQIDYGPIECNEEVIDSNTDMNENRKYRDLNHPGLNMKSKCSYLNNTGHWQRNMHGRTGGSCMGYSHYRHAGFMPNEVPYIRLNTEKLIDQGEVKMIDFDPNQSVPNLIISDPQPTLRIARPINYFYDTSNSGLILVQSTSDPRKARVYANMYAHSMVNKYCDLFKAKFEILHSSPTQITGVKTCLNFFKPSNLSFDDGEQGKLTVTVKRPYKLNFVVNHQAKYSHKGEWHIFKRHYATYPFFASVDRSAQSESEFNGFDNVQAGRKIPIVELQFAENVRSLGLFINYMTAVAKEELIGMDEPLIVNRNGVVRQTDYNPISPIDENSIQSDHPHILVRRPPFPGHISLPPYTGNYYEMYADKSSNFKLSNLRMNDGSVLGDGDQIVFQQYYADIGISSDRVVFRNTGGYEFAEDELFGEGDVNMPVGWTHSTQNKLLTTTGGASQNWASIPHVPKSEREECIQNGDMSKRCFNHRRLISHASS
jgi:hypothetical protein